MYNHSYKYDPGTEGLQNVAEISSPLSELTTNNVTWTDIHQKSFEILLTIAPILQKAEETKSFSMRLMLVLMTWVQC